MIEIQIKSLQTPEILINNTQVFFPYKKAEALFYYVLFEKSINRNDAVNLLWDESSDEVGKKNLRHALYVIKKSFGADVLISPHKSSITLNPDIKFIWDVDLFLKGNDLSVYKSNLLQSFNVKNAYIYEEWLNEKRKNLKELYLHRLYNNIINLPYSELSEIERNFENYILEDPFDERIYIFMMEAFRKNKLYLKAIKLYEQLRECLSKELCITPNNEITDLYRSILKEWSEYSSVEEENSLPCIIGRDNDLSFMRQSYKNFILGNPSSILINGEAGIGKSYLIKCFLETTNVSEVHIIDTSCFQIEKDSPLQAWDSIMANIDEYISNEQINIPLVYLQAVSQLFPTFGGVSPSISLKSKDIANTFNYRAAKNGLLRIFSIISKHMPILLIIDDIHWMDSMSLELLSMIIHNFNNKIMLICSSLNCMTNNLLSFISEMSKNNLMSKITLSPLSYEETSEFAINSLGKNSINTDTIDLIFSQTEGNPFFLVELLNTLKKHGISNSFSSKTQDILNGRLTDLSQNSRQLMDIMSLFDDFITIKILQKILDKTELEILDLIDILKANSLITEVIYHNTVCFKISHNMMRQYIYQCQSKYKLRILHNKVGTVLEEMGNNTNAKWYNKLIYHFSLGENHFKTLYYKVNSLDEYSSLNFELYPILTTDIDDELMPSNNIMDYFGHLDIEFNNLRKHLSNDESFMQLEAQYLNSKVRYCILEGFYDEGILTVNKLLDSNFVQKNPKYLLSAMKQMIYYGIQIYDTDLMAKYIKKGIAILQSYGDNIEYAIYMRLNGLLSLMRGDYEISAS
ncbi:MAG: AAA family ATPase, partial [Clostridiaceae bacterium]